MDTTPDISPYYAIHRQQRTDLRRFADAVESAREVDRKGRLRPLAKWARGFARELEHHHTVEDDIFFPALVDRVPTAAAVVSTLDADHQTLEPMIERFTSGAAELADPNVPFGPIHAEMTELAAGLRDFLDRHLDVEDQDLLPLFYRHFTAAEYDTLHEEAVRTTPKNTLGFTVPWFVEALDDDGKAKLRATAPLSMRLFYRATRRSHLRLVRNAFGRNGTYMRSGGSVAVTIAASPEAVYDVVADITRTGEWSDETHRVEWTSDERGRGARFKGWNRTTAFKWTRQCEVVFADRGRAFAFRTIPGLSPTKRDSTTWRFDLVPVDGGTRIVQSYELTKLPLKAMVPFIAKGVPHHFDMRPHMASCLVRLRALVEASTHESESFTIRPLAAGSFA